MKVHAEFNSLAEMASFARYLNQFRPDDPKPKQTVQESEDSWRWKFEKTQANLERALHRIRILDPEGKTANYDAMPDAPIKGTNVYDLELSIRAYNCLQAAGIKTIEQLCDTTYKDLRKLPNLGRGTAQDIINELAKRKLKLKGL
jgi:DNA-directed RNA polymerase alpha subunit